MQTTKFASPLARWRSSVSTLIGDEAAAHYLPVFDRAMAAEPSWMTHMAPLIEEQFRNPTVLAIELYRHSTTEGTGAKTIEHVGRAFASGPLQDIMIAHAEDEIRHSKMFAALARHYDAPAIPSFDTIIEANEDFIANFDGNVDWFLSDTHIAELRNLAILDMYITAARTVTPTETWAIKTFEKIFDDEWRHVSYTASYTADLLSRSSANVEEFVSTAIHYNHLTMGDVDRLRQSLHDREHV